MTIYMTNAGIPHAQKKQRQAMSTGTTQKVRICECYTTRQGQNHQNIKNGGGSPFSFFVFVGFACCLNVQLGFCLIDDLVTIIIKRLTDVSELRHLEFGHTNSHLNLDNIAIAILIYRNSHEEKKFTIF